MKTVVPIECLDHVENQLTINVKFYFWVLISVPSCSCDCKQIVAVLASSGVTLSVRALGDGGGGVAATVHACWPPPAGPTWRCCVC